MHTLTRVIHILCIMTALLTTSYAHSMWRIPDLNWRACIAVMQPEKEQSDALELKKRNQNQLRVTLPDEKKPTCFICLDAHENLLTIPCNKSHPESMCLSCYHELLAGTDNCPLCHNLLKT
jgi:RNA polymerase subunit RPABC4/transcription elongation factor Spt4